MSHLFRTNVLPPVPRSISPNDPRLQSPPSRVGQLVTDPDEPGWTGIITWDPTYRNPRAWGFSRGLLMADEGAPNLLRGDF
jgi:hypothetical protein